MTNQVSLLSCMASNTLGYADVFTFSEIESKNITSNLKSISGGSFAPYGNFNATKISKTRKKFEKK